MTRAKFPFKSKIRIFKKIETGFLQHSNSIISNMSDSEYHIESEDESEDETDYYDPPKLPEEPTIDDYTRAVGYESCWVDVKQYSHNLISHYLRKCATKYGNEEANKIIKKTGLERLGWKCME